MKHWAGILAFFLLWPAVWVGSPQTQMLGEPEYLSPLPDAQLVSPGTTIAIRMGAPILEDSISDGQFSVTGSQSGAHSGHAILADDGLTVIFKPDLSFSPGEVVDVTINPGVTQKDGQVFGGKSFRFSISAGQRSSVDSDLLADRLGVGQAQPAEPTAEMEALLQNAPNYRTVPDDFPAVGVLTPANGTADGYLFLSSFQWSFPASGEKVVPYLLILDNNGQPVYYKRLGQSKLVLDFKLQPNGLLTYFDDHEGRYIVMDQHYNIVNTIQAGDGYPTDFHELLILPNGNALLMIYDTQTMDMSRIVTNGKRAAEVTGLILQELDPSGNVILDWRSWDHFQVTDSDVDLTADKIDYVHGNAIEVDTDGNLLISSRNMDEITKIDRKTRNIIWRLGGKKNQFNFTNTPPFFEQHDIRRLPTGNITLFDNRADHVSVYSRALELSLNESAKTATYTWLYRNTPDTYSLAMGSVRRLSNGNTLIGWGTGVPTLTEVKPDGLKALELTLASPNVSYRAYRFPWQGAPETPPDLVVEAQGSIRSLFFSWNGATNVYAYRIYGGGAPTHLSLLGMQVKTGFETTITLTDPLNSQCYFQVVPVDNQGNSMKPSQVVYSGSPCKDVHFLPLVSTR